MKKENLDSKQIHEMEEMVFRKREELRKTRFGIASGKVKNVKSAKETRRNIARILTAINKKNKK